MAERDWDREREWDRGRRYREGYSGSSYDRPGDRGREREREYGRRDDERGLLERAGDEVRSWFGDEDATRRRTRDERSMGRWGGGPEDVDPEWARQWGYLEGRSRRASERGWGYGPGPGDVGESSYGPPRGGWGWTTSERGVRPRSGPVRGSFAGRGPHGYQRSDERIREDICERMCDDDELDASGIEILVVGGEVTLKGTVHDRYDKRLAEDLTERVSGVREINNQLRLAPGASGQEGQGQQDRPGDPPRYRVA